MQYKKSLNYSKKAELMNNNELKTKAGKRVQLLKVSTYVIIEHYRGHYQSISIPSKNVLKYTINTTTSHSNSNNQR